MLPSIRTALLLALLAAPAAAAQPAPTSLPNSNPIQGVLFGYAVDVEGDRMVVSAPQDNRAGAYYGGSVAVYDKGPGGWVETAVLTPATPDTESFGISVALDDDRLAIGAHTAQGATGRVYVYDLAGGAWLLTQIVTANDAAPQTGFGYAVALQDDRLVASSPASGQASGAAYVFDLVAGAWTQTAKLEPAVPTNSDMMGLSVALDGSRVVAGAPGPFQAWTQAPGLVHVFDESGGTWAETVLTATDPSIGARFGESVDVEGDRIAVGAPWKSIDAGRQGAAYVFDLVGGAWAEQRRFDGLQPDIDRMLGYRVSLDGARLATSEIGAGIPTSRDTYGRVIVYETDGSVWARETVIEAPTQGESDYFGAGLDLDGGKLAAGAYQTFVNGASSSGAAYVYDLAQTPPLPDFLASSISIYKVDALVGDIHANSGVVFHRRRSGYAGSYQTNVTTVAYADLMRRVRIDGDVTAGIAITTEPQVTVTGAQTAPASVPSILLPATVPVAPGSQNVTVAVGQSQAVAPGPYKRLKVEGEATLTSGRYDFEKLIVRPGATLRLDVTAGPIDLRVRDKAFFARDVVVETVANGVVDLGRSDEVTLRTAQTDKLVIGPRSQVVGTIEAPLGKVWVYADATFIGSVATIELQALSGSRLLSHGTAIPSAKAGTPVAADEADAPEPLALTAAPNPARGATTLQLVAPAAGHATLTVHDALGREVARALDEAVEAGTHRVELDAAGLPAGAYLVRLRLGDSTVTKRITMVR